MVRYKGFESLRYLLLSQDSLPQHFYVVKDGAAAAFAVVDAAEVQMRVYGQYDYFGETALLSGNKHTTTVRARTTCTVIPI